MAHHFKVDHQCCCLFRCLIVFLYLSRLVCSSVNRIRHENNAHHHQILLKQIGRRSPPTTSNSGVHMNSGNYRQEEKKILDEILDREVYDARMRPNGYNASDGPTIVKVNLYFRSFEKIDDVKMEYSVQITFRQQWNDNRLAFNNMDGRIQYLTMTDASRVWMPDTFFRNEKEGQFHRIIQPNLYIRVYPYGDILYSIRVSLTLSCPMTLELFPLDTQICYLRVASYGFTTDDVIYQWKLNDSVQFAKSLFLPGGFELSDYIDGNCDITTVTGRYSCLTVDMTFKRQLSYYILTIYVPTLMIVMVSWLSFWLDHKSAPARVTLTVTTLLAMSTTTSSINNSLPPVAYTKAIDVWTNLCVTFVFLALLEYALVNYAARADAKANALMMEPPPPKPIIDMEPHMENGKLPYAAARDNYQQVHKQDPFMRRMEGSMIVRHHREPKLLMSEVPRNRMGRLQTGSVKTTFKEPEMLFTHEPQANQPPGHPPMAQPVRKVVSEAKRIDVISRIMFPSSFLGFNIMYWSYYLTRSRYQNDIRP